MAKILIIEDEESIREVYTQILKESGFTIDEAKDGEEGLEKASQGGYDLILLDIIMPKKDGLSVLKELQTHPPIVPNKKIVMLSVLNSDQFIQSSLAMGADGYLIKSVLTPDQVVSEVNNFLS